MNNLKANISNKAGDKLSFKNPISLGLAEPALRSNDQGFSKQKSTVIGTRKILNQMLAKMTPMSATNAASKHKTAVSAFSGYNSRSMHRTMKQSRSIDLREPQDSSKFKAFRKNNLSVTVDQSRQAYGFNPSSTTTPVDKM